jgi:hypothetical protein
VCYPSLNELLTDIKILTKCSYIRTMVVYIRHAMLHRFLTHIRASIFAAMLLYLSAIPVLFIYFKYLFSLLSKGRNVDLRWLFFDTLYVVAVKL